MICLTPNKITSDPSTWSPKQWIGLCNTFLLFLVTFFCCLVMYEIRNLDQRFIRVIDSSTIDIDLMSVDLIDSPKQPYWRDVKEGLAVYSAFYHPPGYKFVTIIGSSSQSEIHLEDIRCLVRYVDGEVGLVDITFSKSSGCSAVFIYCSVQRDSLPSRVALVSVGSTVPKQWMVVEVVPDFDLSLSPSSVVACVKPLTEHVSAADLENLVKLHQFGRIEQFYLYNYNASEKVMDSLLRLISKGHHLRVMTWNRKINVSQSCTEESAEYIQDCKERSLFKFSHVVMADVSKGFLGLQKRIPVL